MPISVREYDTYRETVKVLKGRHDGSTNGRSPQKKDETEGQAEEQAQTEGREEGREEDHQEARYEAPPRVCGAPGSRARRETRSQNGAGQEGGRSSAQESRTDP